MIYSPPWLEWARDESLTGVVEVPGSEHNERVIFYHSFTSLHATTDEVPWCASFVCAALASAGFGHTGSARARSYLNWGIDLRNPFFGCVVVFKRGTDHDATVIDAPGHVGFLIDIPTPDEVVILGGNQSNKVCERTYPLKDVLSYRGPA